MKISYSQAAALEVVPRAQSESELWVMLHMEGLLVHGLVRY